jgi:isopenicillin N synthase-like dioxygenase
MNLPVVNVSPLLSTAEDHHPVAAHLRDACGEFGFFYISGHGVEEELQARLSDLSRTFFAQPLKDKLEIDMSHAGRAWRGYFPVGGELTSGKPDLKEGVYFGAELGLEHPMVSAGAPLHGPNLFPAGIPEFRETVLDYMAAMTRLGHALMAGIALSLGLNQSYFEDAYIQDPLILFRIFNYPARSRFSQEAYPFGVGEHTDYGFLTILKQDLSGGLQVKAKSQWIDVEPISNTFVCNIGDMLDRLTGGRYLSAPHRVQHRGTRDRLSFAFFFDPSFNAQIKPLPIRGSVRENKADRWDRSSVHEFQGTYGDYLLGKVSKVFPHLSRELL